MALYLVRHAQAGDRDAWEGPDAPRPLTARGRRQAEALVDQLGAAPARVLSSPAVRCVQTVEPLAAAAGVAVEVTDALAEGAPFEAVLDLLATLPDGAVLCSHGDLIPDLVDALVRRGMAVDGGPDWRKGATWVFERDADGSVVSGRALPPPDREARS